MVLRLIEDLGALAEVGRAMSAVDWEATARDLRTLAVSAERLSNVEETLTRVEADVARRVDQLDTRAAAILEVAERVDANAPSIERLLGAIEGLRQSTETLAATVEPLQGASERLGRITDRLPGARPPRS